jgi:hypothetical protein
MLETYLARLRRRVASLRVFFFCHGLNLRIYSQPLRPSACLGDSQHEVPVWFPRLTITTRHLGDWRCRPGDILLFYVHLIVLLNLNLLGLAFVRLHLLLYLNRPGCVCEMRLSLARLERTTPTLGFRFGCVCLKCIRNRDCRVLQRLRWFHGMVDGGFRYMAHRDIIFPCHI